MGDLSVRRTWVIASLRGPDASCRSTRPAVLIGVSDTWIVIHVVCLGQYCHRVSLNTETEINGTCQILPRHSELLLFPLPYNHGQRDPDSFREVTGQVVGREVEVLAVVVDGIC